MARATRMRILAPRRPPFRARIFPRPPAEAKSESAFSGPQLEVAGEIIWPREINFWEIEDFRGLDRRKLGIII